MRVVAAAAAVLATVAVAQEELQPPLAPLPSRLVVAVDCSGSMASRAPAALAMVAELLAAPNDDWEVAVVAFGDVAEQRGYVKMPDAKAAAEIAKWIKARVGPTAGTDVVKGLRAAGELKPEAVVLVTDGEFNLEDAVTAATAAGVPVWVVHVGLKSNRPTAAAIAKATGGGAYVR